MLSLDIHLLVFSCFWLGDVWVHCNLSCVYSFGVMLCCRFLLPEVRTKPSESVHLTMEETFAPFINTRERPIIDLASEWSNVQYFSYT